MKIKIGFWTAFKVAAGLTLGKAFVALLDEISRGALNKIYSEHKADIDSKLKTIRPKEEHKTKQPIGFVPR